MKLKIKTNGEWEIIGMPEEIIKFVNNLNMATKLTEEFFRQKGESESDTSE